MLRASTTSNRSQRLSQDDNTDGAHDHDQSTRLDNLPPTSNDTPPPADDDGERFRLLAVQLPASSGISNSGQPRPSEPHIQEHTSDDTPHGGLTAEAHKKVQEDQPSPSEVVNVMKQVLNALKDSTTASKSGNENRSRFWGLYKRVAEEHDDEFLERYNSDMDIVLVFSGLFSAVSTSFIVAMESNLSQDPNETTHALLTQLVQIGLGNFTAAGSTPAAPAPTWSPSTADIRIQSIAYASLSFSLLAAFGAVLGKQWLGYYKSQRYGRGSQEERAKRRQEKFDGIVTWHFDAVLQLFPVLLQISLLLFGIALSANLWSQQHTIAWVIIATTVFGYMFYSLTVMAALVSPACPFQTPISTILCMMRMDRVLRALVKLVFRCVLASMHMWLPLPVVLLLVLVLFLSLWPYLLLPLPILLLSLLLLLSQCLVRRPLLLFWLLRLLHTRSWTEFFDDPALAVRSLVRRIAHWLRSLALPTPTSVVDTEAQPPDQTLDVVATNQCLLKLKLPHTPTSSLEAPSIKWLLETSTDPEVFLAAASFVPHVDWPLDLDVSDMLRQLYDDYNACLDIQKQIVPSLEEKASTCTKALCHLCCGRILQGRLAFAFLGEGSTDYGVFREMLERTEVKDNVLVATTKLVTAKNASRFWQPSLKFGACPDSVLEWLSYALPFHFVTGQVDEDVETLAMTVISKLLSPPSSPSPQTIANCTLLACVMVGVQLDKKDIVRVDKSSALPQLTQSLWAHFRTVLWASDGSGLNSTVRRVWHLDIICRVLDSNLPDLRPPREMWNLVMCCKLYVRARSSEQNDRDSSASLLKVQRFRFTVNRIQARSDHDWLWQHQITWQSNSQSQEDFDWLADWLADHLDVYPNDHKTASDILVLLSSMSVSCSSANQRPYIQKLVACMGSNMPPRLRHASLRAAHSSREALASIDVVDDADMVLANLSSAILTAVCPRPDATPTDGDPDCFFHQLRDLCYLELVFALTKNSVWRQHLVGGGHIDRCSRIIAKSCKIHMSLPSFNDLQPHAFYLAGIFLRTASEKLSDTSLSSITEQQWWDMMRKAWNLAFLTIDIASCVEFLPVLVKGTEKYMRTPPKSDLEELIKDLDVLIRRLERRDVPEQRDSDRVAVADMKGLRNEVLEKVNSFQA